MADFDLVIIGGGINGTAIARDAAGRGLHVLLAEQNDLGCGTSSTSTKLIHGGLRYLEHGAFRLVREGLAERALLLRMAPHIIWPARFVLPHHKSLRPAWQLRLGLFLYDMLGGNRLLPGAKRIDLAKDVSGAPLQSRFHTGFEYSDCCVDDARLVVLNALDAAEHGASIRTRTRFEKAERKNGRWQIALSHKNQRHMVSAGMLVNAAGPWIEGVNAQMPPEVPRAKVRLVKGSHIVVRRIFQHGKAYIFQNGDGRIVFAIPYERDFTLIGTTDLPFTGDPASVAISPNEVDYLCRLASGYFKNPVAPGDVVRSFAGIRALIDNRAIEAKDLSRDYLLEVDAGEGRPPLLSVYGGKLTAARHLAEVAMEKLQPFAPMKAAWTGQAPLPGGDFPWDGMEKLLAQSRARWPFLQEAHLGRLAYAYGTRMDRVIGKATRMEEMGICFGGDLTENEVRYLMQHEWAVTAEDILWRRSKLGLHLTITEQESLARFMTREGASHG